MLGGVSFYFCMVKMDDFLVNSIENHTKTLIKSIYQVVKKKGLSKMITTKLAKNRVVDN